MKTNDKPIATRVATGSNRDTKPDNTSQLPKIESEGYGLKGQLSSMVDIANAETDAVSMLVLGRSMEDTDGAVVILRGHHTVSSFRLWAEESGLKTPNSPSGLVRALENDESVPKGPNSWVSPPMVCPCPDPDHVERCVEVGCRRHPVAGLRCFVFADRAVMRCSQCMAAVFVVAKPAPVSQCAISAVKSNDSN
ncbi:MAG: hypothetical protein ACRBN8_19825 [Nannocystales bacterium]